MNHQRQYLRQRPTPVRRQLVRMESIGNSRNSATSTSNITAADTTSNASIANMNNTNITWIYDNGNNSTMTAATASPTALGYVNNGTTTTIDNNATTTILIIFLVILQ